MHSHALTDLCCADHINPPLHSAPPDGDILLTGATGFIGRTLVPALLQLTPANLVCLVRSDDGAERLRAAVQTTGRWRDAWDARLKVIRGDVQQPRLGLSESDYAAWAERCSYVCHAASPIHVFHPYEKARITHVVALREILQFACTRVRKPTFVLSSLAVFGANAYKGQLLVEDDPLEHGPWERTASQQSQWVAEKIMQRARARDIQVSSCRLLRLSSDSLTGAFHPRDLLLFVYQACVAHGIVPDIDIQLSWNPVDAVAARIARLIFEPAAWGQVLHTCFPCGVPFNQVAGYLRSFGYELKSCDSATWHNTVIGALPAAIAEKISDAGFTLSDTNLARVDTSRAQLLAPDINVPPLTQAIFHRFLSQLVKAGFLPAPSMV